MISVLLAGTIGRAVAKPLWHDELFTYYIARIDTMRGLWTALSAGTDLNPPLYYLAVRACAVVTGQGALATRLPAVLGFAVMTTMLYVFVRRRLPARFALIAALTPSLTGAYTYAFEGRPYGLVLGFAAVAMVAWQRAAVSRWLAPGICGAALAAATSTHYYGVLAIVPLAVGELTRIAQRKRLDLRVVLALACGLLPLLVLRPLIAAGRAFAPTFWSPPQPDQLIGSYQLLLDPLAQLVLTALISAAVFAYLSTNLLESAGPATPTDPHSVPADELVVALGFIAIPLVGFAMSVVATGGFHERYVVTGVIGIALLLSGWCATALRSGFATLAVAALLLVPFSARQLAGIRSGLQGSSAAALKEIAEAAALPAGELVVISHAVPYLRLAYFRDVAGGPAVTYLTKPPDVVAATGDTGSRALRLLSRYAPLDIQPFERVAQPGARFYVYGPRSWLIPKLLSQGAVVTLVRESEDASLYLVSVVR